MSDLLIPTNTDRQDIFSMTFEGDSQMDAGLVGLVLANSAFIVDRAANKDPNKPKVKLQVQAFQKGSFSIIFNTVVEIPPQVSVFEMLDAGANIIAILIGIFELKSFLKGKKPRVIKEKEDSKTAVVTSEDQKEIEVPKESLVVLDESTVDKKVSQIATAARLHNPDGGIRFSSETVKHTFDRDAICDISMPIDGLFKSSYERHYIARTSLLIHKPDLLSNTSWGFKSDFGAINAKIEDEDFLDLVHKGLMSYKAGDSLDVDLLTIEHYSANDVLIKTSRIIQKVHRVIPAILEQTSLNLDDAPQA